MAMYIVPGPLGPLLLVSRSLLLCFYLLQCSLVISGLHLFISGLQKKEEEEEEKEKKGRKEGKETPFHQPWLL